MRAPKAGGVAATAASRLGGLVRPSSGYFSYSSSHKKVVDSDTESINVSISNKEVVTVNYR